MDVSAKDSITPTDVKDPCGQSLAGVSPPIKTPTSCLNTISLEGLDNAGHSAQILSAIKDGVCSEDHCSQASAQEYGNSTSNMSTGLQEETGCHVLVENSIPCSNMKVTPQQFESSQSKKSETEGMGLKTESVTSNLISGTTPDRAVDKDDGSAYFNLSPVPECMVLDTEDLMEDVTVGTFLEASNSEPEKSRGVEKHFELKPGSQTSEDAEKLTLKYDNSLNVESEPALLGNIEGSVQLSDRPLDLEESITSLFCGSFAKIEDIDNSNHFQHNEPVPTEGQLLASSCLPVESKVQDAGVAEILNPQILDKQGWSVDPTEECVSQELLSVKSLEGVNENNEVIASCTPEIGVLDAVVFENKQRQYVDPIGEGVNQELLSVKSAEGVNENREVIASCTQEIGVVTGPIVEISKLPDLEREVPEAPEMEDWHLGSLEISPNLPTQCTGGSGQTKDDSIESSHLCSENLVFETSQDANKVSSIVDEKATDVKHDNAEEVSAYMKGQKVCKVFGRKKYMGEVVGCNATTGWFKVLYEDGDEEDLEKEELDTILVPPDGVSHSVSRKRPLSSVVSQGKSGRSKARKKDSASTPRGGKKTPPSKSLKRSSQKKKSGSSQKEKNPLSVSKSKQENRRILSVKRSEKSCRKVSPTSTGKSSSERKPKIQRTPSVKKSEEFSHKVSLTSTSKRKPRSERKPKIQRTPAVKKSEESSRKVSLTSTSKRKESLQRKPKTQRAPSVKKSEESSRKVSAKRRAPDVPIGGQSGPTPKKLKYGSPEVGSKKHKRSDKDKFSKAAATPVTEVRRSGRGRRANIPGSGKGSKAKESESTAGKERKHDLVGKKVKKDFGGVLYNGEVVGYRRFYKVLYEDGDREDLTWKELETILVDMDSTN